MSEQEQEQKRLLQKTFDSISDGYDCKALRFFTDTVAYLPDYLCLKGNEHVLDVATGTGNAAILIAGSLPDGWVTGVDFSNGMLSRASAKVAAKGIRNVRLTPMDMQALEFPDNHFDSAVSSFGVFFVQDMLGQLRHISEKVKPGGRVVITSFHESTFDPLNRLFLERLARYGINVPPESMKRLSTESDCIALFESAGLRDVAVDRKELGYYLDDADQWWNIVWNAGFRRFVSQLAPEKMEQFKSEHLKEIEELSTENGIWLEVNILFTTGIKT